MTRTKIAEGGLKLVLDDKDLKKNLESLKKIESKMEIDSNIEDIIGKMDKLSEVESEVDFQSNIDEILKDIEGIQKTSSDLKIDSNFDDIKKQLDSIKTGDINLDSNADQIRSQIEKIKGDLAEKQTIKADVDVDQTEFTKFKDDISQKFTIKAAITAAGAAVGENTAVEYNDVVKMMKERGLNEDSANDIIKTGLDNGYSLQEIAQTAHFSNKATMDLMAENKENAKEIIAAFVAAERAGAAGADDLSRMVSDLKAQGFSDDETMSILSQVTQKGIENLNTENAEAIREFLPKMKGFEAQDTTQRQYVNAMSQMDITGTDMAGQIGDALYQIALNTQGQDYNEVLKNIKSGSYENSDTALSELGIDREKYHQLQNYLEGVNLDSNLSESRDYLESISSANEEQRSYMATIIQEIQKLGVESGFMKNARDIFAGIGGVDALKTLITAGVGGAAAGRLGSLLNILKGLGTTEAGATGTAAEGVASSGALAFVGVPAIMAAGGYLGMEFGAKPTIDYLQGMFFDEETVNEGLKAREEALQKSQEADAQLTEGLLTSLEEMKSELSGAFTETLPAMVEGMDEEWESLKEDISDSFKQSWENTKAAIWEKVGTPATWGKDMMKEFADGIKEGTVTWVNQAITEVIESIKERLHFTLPDKGPLREVPTWGKDMMEEFAGGMSQGRYYIQKEIDSISPPSSEGSSGSSVGGSKVVNLYYTDNGAYTINGDSDLVEKTRAQKEALQNMLGGRL
ncbi:hypothetical protein [Methanococcus maripaludis]|uniref:Copper chaperone CopZ n=1 Tax=Methanococcus maripaludis TaxID=39152 RepID=A0A8T4CNW9_METMI|nr:hypothetical protein [Methanococcus maripaludis]MBM7408773.1 copper chaperone CopZ [Methanococcus maripaludis]MBP2219058.1 copper chaperone CopZ [Methanococcus maripaludis]